ncbi:MAG: glycosyltransferase family 2 protein [Mesorhizobium sp.]|nr:glycosyltransferase family 2 protein [Mesorhizobium sp.]MBL8579806.1 glycosyltransferase family 2 protein [Mesorhizobium sp.]
MNAPFPHPEVLDAPVATPGRDVCIATVSLIVPLHNEEEAIAPFLEAVYRNTELLTEQGIAFDFIFVNDGSTDDTLDTLLKAQKDDPRIRIIDLSRNFGKDAAMTAGLDYCDADAAIPIDVDLQDPPQVIPQLIEKWREGYEVVLAKPSGHSLRGTAKRRSALNPVQNLIATRKTSHEVRDFRLMDRQVVDALRSLPERQRHMRGLLTWVGFRTTSFDYDPEFRSAHPSQPRSRNPNTGRTGALTQPLQACTWLGAASAALALVYCGAIAAKTLIFGADIPAYAWLLASVLFIGGVQLVGIGVTGRYLVRMDAEIKQRPVYLLRRIYGS